MVLFRFILHFLECFRRWTVLFVLVLMLAFTIASHTIEAVYVATRDAIVAVSGVAPDHLPGDRRKLRSLEADLQRERSVNTDLRRENADLRERNMVTLQGERMSVREAMSSTSRRISGRVKRTAASNIGSMAGEGIPGYGIAVVVASTGYELKSACDTMTDLYELEQAMAVVQAAPDVRDEVCGMEVPTGAELWGTIKSSPSAAWEGAKRVFASLPDWEVSWSDPDFSGRWESVTGWFWDWF